MLGIKTNKGRKDKGAKSQATSWRELLSSSAERNATVELAKISIGLDAVLPVDGEVRGCRVRLLAFDPETGQTIVERPLPTDPGYDGGFVLEGVRVEMVIQVGMELLSMSTVVMGPVRFELNSEMKVPGIMLESPESCEVVQRRSFFRVPTSGLDLSAVELEPTGVEVEVRVTGNDEAGSAFEMQMLDVSGGGIGLLAPASCAERVHEISRYRCAVQLPQADDPLLVDGRVAHVKERSDGEFEVGLEFEFSSELERRLAEDRLLMFTAWAQRQQLQNLRRRR